MYRKFDEDYRGCVQASAGTTHCSPGGQLAEWRETWALSMSFHLTYYLQYLHTYSIGFSRAQKFHHIFFIKLRRQYRYIYTGCVDILIQIQCVSKHRVCRYLERMSRQQTVRHQEHGTRTTGTAGAAGQCSKFDTVTVISSTHTHTPHHTLAAIWAEGTVSQWQETQWKWKVHNRQGYGRQGTPLRSTQSCTG